MKDFKWQGTIQLLNLDIEQDNSADTIKSIIKFKLIGIFYLMSKSSHAKLFNSNKIDLIIKRINRLRFSIK